MRRSKALPVIALLSGAAIALSACGGGGSNTSDGASGDVAAMAVAKGEKGAEYTAPEVKPMDAVTVSTDNPFTTYNNATADGNNSYNNFVLVMVQTGAYMLDGNNKVILNKDVMESVDVTSKSPQEVTWKLKSGLKWSDGAPWNCDDFYMQWLTQSGKAKKADGSKYFLAASSTGYDLMDGSCKDDQTFVGKFSSPYPDYQGLFSTDHLPAHIAAKQAGIADIKTVTPTSSPDQLAKLADFWNTGWNGFKKEIMPASGPYMITEFVQNQSVTLERNPSWVGKPAGPSKITLKAIPDPVAQAQALENGEVSVNSFAQPDGNAADRLRGLSAQGVSFGAAPGLSYEHLDMNFKHPALANQEVRKAFFQCVNRQDIVNKLITNVQPDAKPLGSLLLFPQDEGYTDVYSDKSTGKADDAKKTLQDAGWTQGADGIFEKGGVKASFRISHTAIPRRKQTAELIQGQCKAAGIEIKDDTDPNFLDDRVSKGDYDVALFAWSGGPFKAEKQAIYSTGGGQNWQNLSVPAADKALGEAVTQTDLSSATKFYQEADKALAESYGSLPLFQAPNMWAFKGVDRVYNQSYYGVLWNANEWQPANK
jgi:peptide/nickel transport system substrate-binding protein